MVPGHVRSNTPIHSRATVPKTATDPEDDSFPWRGVTGGFRKGCQRCPMVLLILQLKLNSHTTLADTIPPPHPWETTICHIGFVTSHDTYRLAKSYSALELQVKYRVSVCDVDQLIFLSQRPSWHHGKDFG